MKKLLSTLCLIASAPLIASTVYTNDSVNYKNANGDTFLAYRSLSSCLNWYHLPGSYNELSSYITYPSLMRLKLPKVEEPSTLVHAMGYGLNVDLQLSPPELQNVDEEAFRQKIAAFVNNIVAKNKTDKKFAHYVDCPTKVDAKDISLNRLMVLNKKEVTILPSSINHIKPDEPLSSKKTETIDRLSDAYNKVNVTLLYDLSNPKTESLFQQTFNGGQKQTIGQSRFKIYGKERVYDATLQLKGVMSARWESELTTVDCKKSSSSGETNLGTSMPGSHYIPNFGNMPGVGLNQKKEVSVCFQKLLTRMAQGNHDMQFEFELDKNTNLENKFVTECDNGECTQIKLDTWIRNKLYEMWIQNNFTVTMQRIADNVFEPVIRPKGDTRALINSKVSLGENFIVDVDLGIPVSLQQVRKSFPLSVNSQRLQCLWGKYDNQTFDYLVDTATSLVPITKDCLEFKD